MAKGGNFENEICKLLSLAYSKGKRDDLFARTDGSGGKATRRRKKGKETANASGDIGIADVLGKPLIDSWCIECKTGYASKKSKFGIEYKRNFKKGTKIQQKWFSSLGERDKWIDKNGTKISDMQDLPGIKECNIPWDVLDLIDSQQKETQLEKFWKQCTRDAELTNRNPFLIFRRNGKSPCIAYHAHYMNEEHSISGVLKSRIYIHKMNICIVNLQEFLSKFKWEYHFGEFNYESKKKEKTKTTCKPKTSRKMRLRST
jgi:hypothetical protein